MYNDNVCNNMFIKLDYNNMMDEYIGSHGISKEEFIGLKDEVIRADTSFKNKKEEGILGWCLLPYTQNEIVSEIKEYVESMKDKTDNFVIFGIGGSALGPMAVHYALSHLYYNEISKEKRNGYPKFYVYDNIDPEKMNELLDVIDINHTLFNIISKSGSTCETMAQFIIIKNMLEEKLGKEKARERIVCTTDGDKGSLLKISKEEGYKLFFIPENVGGRFSLLSPVGLLPAAMCGIDIVRLLQGAATMDERLVADNVFQNPAYMYAILNYIGIKKAQNITVMMPYCEKMKFFADWYAQLWAESLGKKRDSFGNDIYYGQTPVKSLGVTDQHSQVQLYTEGPFDKNIVFLTVEKFSKEFKIPDGDSISEDLNFLKGKTLSRIMEVEQMATEYAITKAGRPNMSIVFPEISAFTLGQFIFMMEAATAFMGELAQINAFDQPGVEEGKNVIYSMLGKKGYEGKKEEFILRQAKINSYII